MQDAPWVRTKDSTQEPLARWHMPAGEGATGFILTACDRSLSAGDLDESLVTVIPSSERCEVCQGVYAMRQQNPG